MYLCYVDEAGCTGLLVATNLDVQPVFVIAGIIISQKSLVGLTQDFLNWRRQYNPGISRRIPRNLDLILEEVPKGSALRKAIRKNKRKRRYAISAIKSLIDILEKHNIRLLGRIFIKPTYNDRDINDTVKKPQSHSLYTSSIQSIYAGFNVFCYSRGEMGVVILDSRDHSSNCITAHSIFTQQHKISGTVYPNIAEPPLFGDSRNHAGIQIADLICSALLYPMATYTYCTPYLPQSQHINNAYGTLREHFGRRIRNLQFRYDIEKSGVPKRGGGIVVSDPLGNRHGGYLFG